LIDCSSLLALFPGSYLISSDLGILYKVRMLRHYTIPRKTGNAGKSVQLYINIYFAFVSEMSKNKRQESETEPSETGDSDSSETSSSESSEEEEEEEVVDIKDQFLPEVFRPKPTKVQYSAWAKNKIRGPFLGTPLGVDERDKIMDMYYCSPADYKLFSPPRITGNDSFFI
jgi:hypothetical protein